VALERFVSSTERFWQVWEQHPFHSVGLGPFVDILPMDKLREWVGGAGLRYPSLQLINEGRRVPLGLYTKTLGSGPEAMSHLIDGQAASASLQSGSTAVFQSAEVMWEPLADLCSELSRETGFEAHANVYATPVGSRGTLAHYDMASAFLRQIYGRKHWQICEPRERWPLSNSPVSSADATRVVEEVVLSEGDCLYIPRGFIHSGWADEDAPSVHVTVSLAPITWLDAVLGIVGQLGAQEDFRECLPSARTESDQREALASARVRALIETLSTPALLEAVQSLMAPGRFAQPARGSMEELLRRRG